ncbi:hypothetical protein [Luteirhabdus pelagi]|uniref:hypothetical protein n=1 Tax=Luteirhabdus pelagi TaxID=2792783 RepID=UPI00193A1EDE|nr:hypothetical protein [Luteirhabdus pelagi]
MKAILFVFALFLPFVGFSQEEQPITPPKIAVKIPLGKTVAFEGVAITFKEVLEDSRCPENATCVWEGRVRALVSIEEEGEEAIEQVVIFGKTKSGEEKNHKLYSKGKSVLKAMKIDPYPVMGVSKEDITYTLYVYIESIG